MIAPIRKSRNASGEAKPRSANAGDGPPSAAEFKALRRLLDETATLAAAPLRGDLDSPYLTSMLRTEVLGPALEQKLFLGLEECRRQTARLQQQADVASRDLKIARALKRWTNLAAEIRNRIVAANVRLVVSVAKKFAGVRRSMSELVSDGNLTLLRAVEKFDVSRGFRFSTYATWALRYDFARSVGKKVSQVDGRQASEEQLEAVADAHGDLTHEKRLGEASRALERMLASLDPREHAIIEQRYGLGPGGEERSLQEIASDLGVCKERVRQLQLRALEKLRMLVGGFPPDAFESL